MNYSILFSVLSSVIISNTTLALAENSSANNINPKLTIEELRYTKAEQAMPAINDYYLWDVFEQKWLEQEKYAKARQLVSVLGDDLWQFSKRQNQQAMLKDDRPLYWTRLAITAFLKQNPLDFTVSENKALIEQFEVSSRGQDDLAFIKKADKRILLTGFDPFLLDRNIEQSNPSGLAALLLDGTVIKYKGITAEINTVMIPVRYEDFDQGEIEDLLAPFYALNSVDMIATISMGRTDFDLEHFPGLRRSATAPDNLNVYTGANKSAPIVPKLLSEPLSDIEFVQYSLPYQAMMTAKGPYKVNDNRTVTILGQASLGQASLGHSDDTDAKKIENKTFDAQSLAELDNTVAVEGGGGGYLSNEISYRSILLRNELGSTIPTGHIHTPRIKGFDVKVNQAIIEQIKAILEKSLTEI
jgi:pyrrolidone-carboxylate peptidase